MSASAGDKPVECSNNNNDRRESGDEQPLKSQSQCAFRGVLFDWKGTLEPKTPKETRAITKEQLTQQAISQIDQHLKAAGFHEDDFAAAHGEVHSEIQEKQALVSKGTLVSKSFDKLAVSKSDPNLTRRLQELYLETLRNPTPDRALFPGAVELLEKLKAEGIPIALVRNSTLPRETFINNLKEAGVDHLFDTVVMSGDVGFEKPDAPIFHRAISELGLNDIHESEPHKILFVGNETEADVKGANAMGWKSCLLTSTEPHSDGHAHFEVSDMSELEKVLFPAGSDRSHQTEPPVIKITNHED